MARKPAAVLDEHPDHDDDIETAAADSPADELDLALSELGGADGYSFSIWRKRPRRVFVTKVAAQAFDVADFARTFGGGDFEILVTRAGQPGLVRRIELPIDDAIKPAVSPQLAGVREERGDDTRELMRMMFQQAVESQRQQTQILTALIARPAPQVDPALMALLTQRSSASELAELMKVTQSIGGGGGSDWASVVRAGLEFAAVTAAKTLPPAPAPPRPPQPRIAQNPPNRPPLAVLTTTPAERGAPQGVPNHPPTTADGAAVPGSGVSGQSGAPYTPTPSEQASGQAMGQLLAVFSVYPDDPAPTAGEYARKVVDAIGEERVCDAIDTTTAGELAAQLAGFVSGVPAEFLRDVETTLRAWFEEDEK